MKARANHQGASLSFASETVIAKQTNQEEIDNFVEQQKMADDDTASVPPPTAENKEVEMPDWPP